MHSGNEYMNKTIISLVRKVLDVVSFEANGGKYAWIIEVENSTWTSACSGPVLSNDQNETYHCILKVINLCFTHVDTNEKETV